MCAGFNLTSYACLKHTSSSFGNFFMQPNTVIIQYVFHNQTPSSYLYTVTGDDHNVVRDVIVHSGRIKAIQLEYSEARRTLTNALRKAPQHTAVGFKQTVRNTHTHTHV